MRFVNRKIELAFLDKLLKHTRSRSAQFVLIYGRRRVGKTRLLRHWLSNIDIPAMYWVAEKETASLQRRKFIAEFEQRPLRQAPLLDSWSEAWELVANRIGDKQHILVIDELPYAAQADNALLSSLQHAWDQYFENSQLILILCGSQMRVMETLQYHQSPLFDRFTAQWHLDPLPFHSLEQFFRDWSTEERIALYAIVGGIPAYLNWLHPEQGLVENIRDVILAPGSLFIAEPTFLLYDEVNEPQTFLSILKAIGMGNHTLSEISNYSLIGKTHLSSYLVRLQELKLIERRIPATVPTIKRRKSRQGRYHFSDPYFHFYFRFLAPFNDILPDDIEPVLEKVRSELRGFVGQTAFEQLSQQWVREQRKRDALEFRPMIIGSHWSRKVQVDVVGVNWDSRDILLGECKWGDNPISRGTVRELVEQKAPKLLAELPHSPTDWSLHTIFFARAGFSSAAQQYAREQNMTLVDLETLEAGLAFQA
ncbi:ATP-binding protein [Candidatus Leptofilum sp.]|uniref:ATP-binding protein n=1 Tax=Candidatus Leptofilum sp. TaxID=3241576 RepID=UPI003B5BD805